SLNGKLSRQVHNDDDRVALGEWLDRQRRRIALNEWYQSLPENLKGSQQSGDFKEYLDTLARLEEARHQLQLPIRPTPIFTLLMPPTGCEIFVGDLEERYRLILKKQGQRTAQRWFWRQVFQSLFPLIFAALRRVSGYEKLIEFYQRKRS